MYVCVYIYIYNILLLLLIIIVIFKGSADAYASNSKHRSINEGRPTDDIYVLCRYVLRMFYAICATNLRPLGVQTIFSMDMRDWAVNTIHTNSINITQTTHTPTTTTTTTTTTTNDHNNNDNNNTNNNDNNNDIISIMISNTHT